MSPHRRPRGAGRASGQRTTRRALVVAPLDQRRRSATAARAPAATGCRARSSSPRSRRARPPRRSGAGRTPSRRFRRTSRTKPGQAVGALAPDRIELRRGVEPGLVRLRRSTAGRRRRGRGCGRASRGGGRSPAPPPDRRPRSATPTPAAAAGCRGHRSPRPITLYVKRRLPVSGTSQKIVWPMNPSSRWAASSDSSSRRARAGVDPAPHDRGEARVPVPLPRVVARARARVGERDAVPSAHALTPVASQDRLASLLDRVSPRVSCHRGAPSSHQRRLAAGT